ncbi:hypothetical protein GTQ40_10625 [Flavobacteriaceae bacterium R38]|nr:hypothetical protein [Flavobacteriaceae bacterium R38]
MLDNIIKLKGTQKLSKKEQSLITGGIGFGELGCDTDLDCDSPRLRCCFGICLSFDPRFDSVCEI